MNRQILLIAACLGGLAVPSHASLVAWYKFDEEEGASTALNAVLGGPTGAISSGVITGVAGISGNAYQFDDVSGFVDMGNASFFSSIVANQQMTLSAWINTSVTVGQRNVVVFAGNDAAAANYTDLGYSATGDGGSGIAVGAGYARNRPTGNGINTSTGLPVNDAQWHQLTMTINLTADSNQLMIYLDGSLVGAQTLTGGDLAFPTFNNFEVGRLGRGGNGPTDYFGGLIDDVQVYDSALSAEDVMFLYENPGMAVPEPGALALAGLGFGVLYVASRRKKRA